MASVVVTPSKQSYEVGETVVVQVAVEGAFPGEIANVPVVAAVMVDGQPLTGQIDVEVVAPPSVIEYTGVSAGNQQFTQDPVEPSRWTGVAALPTQP